MKLKDGILLLIISFILGQDVFDGYTLFTPQGGNPNAGSETLLINNDEQTIHSWDHDNGPASMPYLVQGNEPGLENCILVYPYRVDDPTMDSGGVGGAARTRCGSSQQRDPSSARHAGDARA